MILRGWKDICKAVGGISPKTARHLMRTEGFPVDYIAGAPQTTDTLLEAWVENRVKSKVGASEGIRRHQGGIEEPV
jgi:hypothetical protein